MNISATLNCTNILNEMLKNNKNIHNFGLGENKIKQPREILYNINKHLDKKHYVSSDGILELNNIIKKIYSNNIYKISKITFGNGLKELIFLLQLCFEGKIIHITPSWVSYKEQINILKKTDPVLFDLKTDAKLNSNVYSRVCQQSIQPIVLSDEEYNHEIKMMYCSSTV